MSNKVMENRRILLKLSGEALGTDCRTLDKGVLTDILEQIKILLSHNNKIAIVVGGGNIFRGKVSSKLGIGNVKGLADYMGMLGTTINAIGLSEFLNSNGVKAVFQNSLKIEKVSKGLNKKEANKLLDEGTVVVYGGGTGEPFLSTDTAAVRRAIDIKSDLILMAKQGTDGVYSGDPRKDKSVRFFDKITFQQIIDKKLEVVDLEAMDLLKGQNIEILLFNMKDIKDFYNISDNKKPIKNIRYTLITEG